MGRRKWKPPAANSTEQPLFILSSDDDGLRKEEIKDSTGDASFAENSKFGTTPAVEEDDGVAFDSGGGTATKKGKKSKKKKKQRKVELEEPDDSLAMNFVDDEDSEKEEVETAKVAEVEEMRAKDEHPNPAADQPDNLVLRKLLRGPRYFDPPDSSWGNCYHCGGEGHRTIDCTAEKKKKPCYYCGSTEHSFKKCTKGHDCFICKKGGHKAKHCPEKSSSIQNGSMDSKICLRCGDSGHDMFSCRNNYFLEDLEAIQCYVCNRFGHLCCHDSTEHVAKEVSCYKCGHLGHTGMACARLQGENAGTNSPTLCYNCGEGGHFARECSHPLKASSRSRGENCGTTASSTCHNCGKTGHFIHECPSPLQKRTRMQGDSQSVDVYGSCHQCGEEGHFARDCPNYSKSGKRSHDPEKSSKNKKIRYDDCGFSEPKRRGDWISEDSRESHTPRKKSNASRKRGGWIPEEEMEPSSLYRKANMDDRWCPVTPTDWRHQIHPSNSRGQTSDSYRNEYLPQSRSMQSQGSSNQSILRKFPASRFYNYTNDGSSGRSNVRW